MRIGIGLPAAVPGTPGTAIGDWAATSEQRGFESLAVLDRLVYDNLDPLVALAAAAARIERVELLTTILGVPFRHSALVLAKQLASIDQLSGGRLTAGLALGGWPEDYEASGTPLSGRGAAFEDMLITMRRAWSGEIGGPAGPMPALAPGRPSVLLGAILPAGFRRAATYGEGWVARAPSVCTRRSPAWTRPAVTTCCCSRARETSSKWRCWRRRFTRRPPSPKDRRASVPASRSGRRAGGR
jgi:alkanesulfonate monooxygenase SsuD/methylene tetrahydromethanopterin reductase-like flavin-dependent oxidoreductase (luciferase family)